MAQVNIGVFGASGRMGRSVLELVASDFADQARIAATLNSSGSIEDLAAVDVIIDFSLPVGTARLVDWLHQHNRHTPTLVCGTTGLSLDVLDRLAELGETRKVLQSNNFSVGVAAVRSVIEFASPMLNDLGYTPVLTETHHKHKLDAPSGTAKLLCDALHPEAPETVAVHSVRAGEVIGRHDITFYGAHDEIVIGHTANDRRLFANGAIDAALWLHAQSNDSGSYTMQSYFRQRFFTRSPT